MRLPRKTQGVFLLHRVAGLDYETIGQRLNMPVQAVESHLAEALLRLSRTMDRIERARMRRTPPR